MNNLKIIALLLASTAIICKSEAQISATIQDIQFVDPGASSGASPLLGQEVMTTGVVTASAEPNNLDAVFIQQEGRG